MILGKIVGPSGLRGAVKVFPIADDPSGWAKLDHWRVGRETDGAGAWQQTRVLSCRTQGAFLVAELECLTDRNASEAARGQFVGVPRAELPEAGKDEFYWADLIGLQVLNTHDEWLGGVLGLIDTPANAVLRVGDGKSEERLLPFVAAVVLDVDLVAKRVRVEWEADW